MPYRRAIGSAIGAIATTAALLAALAAAQAFDQTKYPDWKGQWLALGGDQNSPWDPSLPTGAAEQARLTPEYRAIFAASVREAAAGGPSADPITRCVPAAMPRVMMAVQPMEIIINPDAAYFVLEQSSMLRRAFTDGRKFPDYFEPTFTGYSIGVWQDTDGDGRYDTLLIETRGVRGPHAYDASGIPFHQDGEAVIMEKLYSDKADPDILHNEITTVDHALTQPWTVTRSYRRDARQTQPKWTEFVCSGDANHVLVGNDYYQISPDGLLMPVRKGQRPPNLKYFK